MSAINGGSPGEPYGSPRNPGDGGWQQPGPSFVDGPSPAGEPRGPGYYGQPNSGYSNNDSPKSGSSTGEQGFRPARDGNPLASGQPNQSTPSSQGWPVPPNFGQGGDSTATGSNMRGSKQPGVLATVLGIILSLALIGALVYWFNERPSQSPSRAPAASSSGSAPAAGPNYHIKSAPEHFLAPDFRSGFTLRQVDDMGMMGYDAANDIYVTLENRYTLFGRDIASGEAKWSLTGAFCIDSRHGRLYCEKDSQMFLLDTATGALMPSYPRPDAFMIDDYLGSQNGLEYFVFSKPTIVAAGVNGTWSWQTNLGDESFLNANYSPTRSVV